MQQQRRAAADEQRPQPSVLPEDREAVEGETDREERRGRLPRHRVEGPGGERGEREQRRREGRPGAPEQPA